MGYIDHQWGNVPVGYFDTSVGYFGWGIWTFSGVNVPVGFLGVGTLCQWGNAPAFFWCFFGQWGFRVCVAAIFLSGVFGLFPQFGVTSITTLRRIEMRSTT